MFRPLRHVFTDTGLCEARGRYYDHRGCRTLICGSESIAIVRRQPYLEIRNRVINRVSSACSTFFCQSFRTHCVADSLHPVFDVDCDGTT